MRLSTTFFFLVCLSSILCGQTISSVGPNSGDRGSWQLPITISGSGTNFSNATSTIVKITQATSTLMDLEVVVNNVTPSSVNCHVRIPNNALLGYYSVSVFDQTIGGMVNLPNGFTVYPNASPPHLMKTTPSKVGLNQVLPVTITVDNANFSQATDNTIFLSNNGTSNLINPVSGTTVGLNNSHIRATFNINDPSLSVGSVLSSHCANSFDGNFTDPFSIEVTAPTSISGAINYSGSYNGVVELYQENVNVNPTMLTTYSLVATATVVSNSYSFNNVAEASYYIRSVPINMSDVVSTYFAADISWQTATLVSTDPAVPAVCNITPVASLSLPGGILVNGTVGFGPNGYNKTQFILAEGVEVFLKDYVNNQFAQTVTNQNGEYTFANVPNGSYILVIDLPGYNQISTFSFGVTSNSEDVNGVDFVINDGEIFLSNFLTSQTIENEKLVVFPNPTNNELSIVLPANLTNAKITIFNSSGQTLLDEKILLNKGNTKKVNVSWLTEGFYFVRVQGVEYSLEQKFIKTK